MKQFKRNSSKKKVDHASLALSLTLIISLIVSISIGMIKNNVTINASNKKLESTKFDTNSTVTAGVTNHIESILKEQSDEIYNLKIKANEVTPVMSSYETDKYSDVNYVEIEGEITNVISKNYSDIEFESDFDPSFYKDYGKYITTMSRCESKFVPQGYGKIHTYMGWQCITSRSSKQYKLRMAAQNFDDEGFGIIGDRYAVAMKPYYGNIGDYLDITQSDGTVYKVVIVDYKGNENGNSGISKYVHHDGSIIEFVVDKNSWYSTSHGGYASIMHSNPGSNEFHPEFGKTIIEISNVGNYWDYDHSLMNK